MKLNQWLPKELIQKPYEGDKGSLISNDLIGVEIEVERAALLVTAFASDPVATAIWHVHQDGSLRNSGYEWVFRKPLGGLACETALRMFQDKLSKLDAKTRPLKSDRTSTHVHINVSDLTPIELARFLSFYLVYERALFEVFAPTRMNNHFCIPALASNGTLTVIGLMAQEGQSWDNIWQNIRINLQRYGAVNLVSIAKFGTIEFRHRQAVFNADNHIRWINALLSLKEYSRQDARPLMDILRDVSRTGVANFTYRVFPPKIATRITSSTDFDIGVMEGIRATQLVWADKKENLPESISKIVAHHQKSMQELKDEVSTLISKKMEASRGRLHAGIKKEGEPEVKPPTGPQLKKYLDKVFGVEEELNNAIIPNIGGIAPLEEIRWGDQMLDNPPDLRNRPLRRITVRGALEEGSHEIMLAYQEDRISIRDVVHVDEQNHIVTVERNVLDLGRENQF